MRYRAEIDGLRAIAVIPVILFHAGISSFAGGYVGVDVFFVISGYLITSIIMQELRRGEFSVLKFYERRARRILPALFLVILFCFPFSLVWLDPFAYKEFSQSVVSVSAFCSNIYFYLKTGYFDTASELKPLLHTWSLAVEEQYYLIFPLILIVLCRKARDRDAFLYLSLAVLFVLSFVSSLWLVEARPSAAFFLINSRAWELLLGSFSSFLLSHGPVKLHNEGWRTAISLFGILLIVFSVIFYDAATPFPGFYALVPTLGTFLIIVFADEGTITARLLSNKVLVGIGLISYGAYLWHQPLLAFWRTITFRNPGGLETAVIFAVTMLLAWATYQFVEKPIRSRRWLTTQKSIFAAALSGCCVFGAAGALGHVYHGFPGRNEGFLRLAQNYGLSERCSGAAFDDARCETRRNPKVVLWGDSHAMHLGMAFEMAFRDAGLRQTTLSGCPPVPNYADAPRKSAISCLDYNSIVKDRLLETRNPQDYLIVFSAADDLSNARFRSDFADSVKLLKSRGFKLLFISSTPHIKDAEECLIQNIRSRGDFRNCVYRQTEVLNLKYFGDMKRLADDLGIHYISLLDLFCDGQLCRIWKDGKILLRDRGHLSVESQPLVSRYVLDRVSAFGDLKKWAVSPNRRDPPVR